MKNILIPILLLFVFFACKTDKKNNTTNTISAEPSAKARTTPHQDGSEQFTLNKGTNINIIGISSNKDKITIGEKAYDEYWYLVKDKNNGLQGWIYGGCISFADDFDKNLPKWDFKLANTQVEIAPCFESFNEDGNPDCGTDCGIGTIYFLNENEFLSSIYCLDGGTDYNLGKYKLSNGKLALTFGAKFFNIPDESEDPNADESEKLVIKPRAFTENFEVHFYDKKPVFLPIEKTEENYLGTPKPINLSADAKKAIDEIRNDGYKK